MSILAYVNSVIIGVRGALDDLFLVFGDSISPDGKLGGRGFVMPLPEVSETLSGSFTSLIKLRNTIMDEFNNPGWGLSKEEKAQILNYQDQSTDNTQSVLSEIDNAIGGLFGADAPGGTGSEDAGSMDNDSEDVGPTEEGAQDSDTDDTAFPDMGSMGDEVPEQPAEQVKTASTAPLFVGFSGKESKVAKTLAGAVLQGLVKKASGEAVNN